MKSRTVQWLVVPLGLLVLGAAVNQQGFSQTNTENFAQLKFNFNNPGARATGIGGAFISIADDATAAEANPAGLTALVRPEVSFELKGINFKREVNNYSFNQAAPPYPLISRTFKNGVISPSFASVVGSFRKFTVSAFRYELVNFESTFYTKGSYIPPVAPLPVGSVFYPVNSSIKMNVTNWGVAVAYKFNEEFSLGSSFGLSHIQMESSLARYFLEVFNPETLANLATIDGSANDFFVNVGFMYHPTENLSIGGIAKRRPMFSLDHTFRFTDYPTDFSTTKKININIPHSFGLGISYRPSDVLTFAFDADWVSYSTLTKNFALTISEQYATGADFKTKDGFELHAGAEYVLLLRQIGFVFRGGGYMEPDNNIQWVGNVTDSNDENRIRARQLLSASFKAGSTTIHGTFGVGILFSNNVQLDLAGNFSKRSDEIVGSFVVRMP